MEQFLHPKSMLTPGIAGALIMLLANSLCEMFPELGFRYVALALSFTIGAFAVIAIQARLLERAVYWVINSLIIFSMGVGTSNIGANLTAPLQPVDAAGRQATHSAAWLSLIPSANAQEQWQQQQEEQKKEDSGFFKRW